MAAVLQPVPAAPAAARRLAWATSGRSRRLTRRRACVRMAGAPR